MAALGLVAALGCRGQSVRVVALPGSPARPMSASADPSIARDPESGDLLLTWVGDDGSGWRLYFARSTDQGASWSDPVQVTMDTGEVKPHGEASPRLVAGPTGRLAVVWPRDIAVAGRQWPASAIRVARSLDGGRTWLPPHTVNDDTLAAPVGHNFQGAAWAGDSGLVAAWLDERTGAAPAAHHHDRAATAGDPTTEPDATVYLARSPDFGRTWERNQATWGGACPCCRITLARHADGRVAAAWRHHFPGNVRDVVVADVEPEPGPPERVHPDGWVYPGCPHNGPGFAVGPDGKRHVVWYTGAGGKVGLYYATVPSTSPGAAPVALVSGSGLPAVHGSVLGLAGGGAVAAYDAAADGSRAIGVAVMRPGERVRSAVVPGGAGGLYPQLAAASAEAVVMAYTGHDGDRPALRLARVALPEADH